MVQRTEFLADYVIDCHFYSQFTSQGLGFLTCKIRNLVWLTVKPL